MSTPDDLNPADGSGSKRLLVGGEWQGVSPKYVGVEVVSSIISGLVLCAVAVVFVVMGAWFGWILLGVAVVIAAVMLVLAPRRVRSIGYQLRADDLVFRRGIMFHRVVSVPYGRMQLIDINRGPVARALGLAELKFVTAAASTGVSIPGLVDSDANDLRDQLVGLAETRRVGL
ncbi:PH domain-containing protein [Herbiconiux daphne]|uniref:PH domain-containing protein n=1 Tax=Herbiconiux daphne TaxID=2970914 RepID=A0ABT2GWL1_9MICO|nr:PH domain-containing protein [Herbiconiux daphne]MCS5732347.1 PH domain-containing protein [Herbiconiux daphne]